MQLTSEEMTTRHKAIHCGGSKYNGNFNAEGTVVTDLVDARFDL